MKKRLTLFIITILLLLGSETTALSEGAGAELSALSGAAVDISGIGSSGGVELKISYGYQNTAKPRRFLPVRMEVENDREQPLTGSVELYMIEDSDTLYCYSYPLGMEAFETREISGNISIGEHVDELLAQVKDSSGNILEEKTVRLNIDNSGPALFIGIISDNPTSLNFMSGVSLNNTSLKARTLFLNADELPYTEEGLDQLDVIVISNYNVNLLDDEVIRVIWDWVENGGVLLLGTGARHNPIGDFRYYLPPTSISSPEIRAVNMGIQYSVDGLEGAVLNIPVSDVYIEGGTQRLSSDALSVLTTVKAGAGTVGITAYDLCDISEFCKEQISYTDELLTALVGSTGIDRLSKTMEAERDEYGEISALINVGNVEKFPNLSLYLFVASAYVLLAGPGLYVFLKQRGLSHMYGPGAAGAAIVASVLIWFMGTSTRMEGPFINYASIREYNSSGETETDFIGIASPYNGPVRLGLNSEYTVRAIIDGTKSERSVSTAVGDSALKRVKVDYGTEETYIETDNMKPFSESVFELYRGGKGSETPTVSGALNIYDGRVEGSITNNSGEDLSDVTVLTYGGVLKVGDIASGESRRITAGELSFGPTGMPYITGNYIMDVEESSANRQAAEYMSDLAGSGLIEYYMENSLGSYFPGAVIIGFSEGRQTPESIVSGEMSCYGTTLLATDADADFVRSSEIYRIALAEEPKLISGEYNLYDNTTKGNAAVVLEYSLGTDVNVTGLKLNSLSEEFEGMADRNGNILTAFDGDIALYNYYTSSYDNIERGKTGFNMAELSSYLSPGNTVTVRYIPKDSTASDTVVFLPIPSITGVSI
ncbi:MAG: hypothetical protein ACOYBV_08500 [Candidatus Avilachnospira sp.]|jgi:hypothetical protein